MSEIFYSTTVFESTQFEASKKEKIVIKKSSKEEDIEDKFRDSFLNEESDKQSSDHNFSIFLVMTLKVVPNPKSKLMRTQPSMSIIYA